MTRTLDPSTSSSRAELDLAAQQLRAIDSFNRAKRMAEDAAAAAGRSREMRMDVDRRLEVIRREHQAIVERVDVQLRLSGDVLQRSAGRRVVVAHRNEWFVGKVSDDLLAHGIRVIARVENGADAIGAAVAEQPDLLVVEDKLAMVTGEQVLHELRRYCPDTLLTAQVEAGDRVGALLDAGARAVFTRRIPPKDVADQLVACLTGSRRPVALL